ncbi:mavicyanin [Ricinus communis]|uniref:Mavicyanin, putative n=1 Tax=Ricinus communis TaxID=3988 RepID=B9RTZ6_RICCO|nr:mavicyanin [Ricinus communis]EEF45378.1 Mavicyanin, putative [Ricinus communis]|eukprot:XP_002517215.1 mavicyanin [Ricinus communis]
MALVKIAVALLTVMALFQAINGTVYKVGDAGGWTSIGNLDYKQWAATKTFKVGDVIVFKYNSQFHNVMRVTHAMYKACNASAPLATYTTGNDSITIKNRGHHYFFCGVPGHCQGGQKVDINVPRSDEELSPTPSASASASASTSTPTSSSAATSPPVPAAKVPGPSPNGAVSFKLLNSPFGSLALAMPLFIIFLFNYAKV